MTKIRRFEGIDYSFRPETYFPKEPTLEERLTRIKGHERRKNARVLLPSDSIPKESEIFISESLTEQERRNLAGIHPTFMGGEYLPDLSKDEAEIARISLESVTADQFSVRVSRAADSLTYSVVDEYESEFVLPFTRSRAPFSLSRLIELIEGTPLDEGTLGLVVPNWEHALEHAETEADKQRSTDFATVSSGFYPSLAQHYSLLAEEWLLTQE